MTNGKTQVWVLDDNRGFIDSLRRWSTRLNYEVLESSGKHFSEKLPQGLDIERPLTVLLDYTLEEENRFHTLGWLNDSEPYLPPETRIYVVSGPEAGADIDELKARYPVAGKLHAVLNKPLLRDTLLSITHPEEVSDDAAVKVIGGIRHHLLREDKSSAAVNNAFLGLGVPVRLFIEHDGELVVIARNEAASDEKSKLKLQRAAPVLQRMLEDLKDEEKNSEGKHEIVRRLDWDPGQEHFVRRRLYRTGDYLWLAEEHYPSLEKAEPTELSFDAAPDLPLDKRFFIQCKRIQTLLLDRFGITRMRIYRAHNCYELGDKKAQVRLEPAWPEEGRWEGQFGSVSLWRDWYGDNFYYNDSEDAKKLFAGKDEFVLARVSDSLKRTSNGCQAVRWGDAGNRIEFRVLQTGGTSPGADTPLALVAMDRRMDLLDEKKRPFIDLGADDVADDGGDAFSKEEGKVNYFIGNNELKQITIFFKRFRSVLENNFREVREREIKQFFGEYEALFSPILNNSKGGFQLAEDTLSACFSALLDSQFGRSMRINNAFIALKEYQDAITVLAGAGDVYTLRKESPSRVFDNYGSVLDDGVSQWAIPDFQHWLRDPKNVIAYKSARKFYENNLSVLDNIGGWLGLPVKVEGGKLGLLVITTRRPMIWTREFVVALKKVRTMLVPTVLRAKAERQQHLLRRVFVHDYRGPLNRLENLLPNLRGDARIEAEVNIALADHFFKDIEYFDRLPKLRGKWLNQGWLMENLSRNCRALGMELDIEVADECQFELKADADLLTHCLLNLARNAEKHSRDDRVSVVLRNVSGRLSLVMANAIDQRLSENELWRIRLPFQRGINAHEVTEGSGIGLSVVDNLCRAMDLHFNCSTPQINHKKFSFEACIEFEPKKWRKWQ